tara:strand:+ start:90 stop:491 length:402 start_codon:yes stop_codon:yes gene_type:complete
MQVQLLTFNDDINISLQVGDIVYYSPTSTVGSSGFSTVNVVGTIVKFGVVTAIYNDGNPSGSIPPHTILVTYDETSVSPPSAVPTPDYIMFGKNKQVNTSSLTGYYADVKFVNYSDKKVELFSVGSEAVESSR